MTSDPWTAVVSNARTVAILVHGVGDHRSVNMLEEARHGLEAVFPRESFIADVMRFRMSAPGIGVEEVQALRVNMSGSDHLLIPFVWSRSRQRFRAELVEEPVAGDSIWKIVTTPFRAVGSAAVLVLDTLRCIPKARPMEWITLLGTAVILGLFIALYSGIMGVAIAFGVNFARGLLLDVEWNWWKGLLFLAILGSHSGLVSGLLGMIQVLLSGPLTILEFPWDVLYFVGRTGRRERVERQLAEFVGEISRRAPEARIILASHSLGTVLVSNALRRLPSAAPAAGNIELFTFGSPMRTMARTFPAVVTAPEKLAQELSDAGIISGWSNHWRDGDPIGKSLADGRCELIRESALGPGGHVGYWKDARAWKVVLETLAAALADASPAAPGDAASFPLPVRRRALLELLPYSGPVLLIAASVLLLAGAALLSIFAQKFVSVARGPDYRAIELRYEGRKYRIPIESAGSIVRSMVWSEDGEILAAAGDYPQDESAAGPRKAWIAGWRRGQSLGWRPAGEGTLLAFAQGGERIVAGSSDGLIHAWDLSADAVSRRSCECGRATALAIDESGRRLAVGGADGSLRVRSPDFSQEGPVDLQGDPDFIPVQAAFSKDARLLVVKALTRSPRTDRDARVRIRVWRAADWHPLHSEEWPGSGRLEPGPNLEFSADGGTLIVPGGANIRWMDVRPTEGAWKFLRGKTGSDMIRNGPIRNIGFGWDSGLMVALQTLSTIRGQARRSLVVYSLLHEDEEISPEAVGEAKLGFEMPRWNRRAGPPKDLGGMRFRTMAVDPGRFVIAAADDASFIHIWRAENKSSKE